MHFSRLRLQGFKSFVDPVDLDIGAGLTGIVGPNGCGKSNLVEALRWVMGETSAKRMRGAEMDDVIFAGTATRPSRNMAEVSLVLDNRDRQAMVEFNNADELVVLRRIERGEGSDYKINGKPARQRDVQVLFADQATGAHSTSVVGQGQIDALIRAKPQDRKQILEEASGTAGLQARRHEAELKLKAAEQNLTRVDDVITAQDTQLRSLKQQIRQASRYRNLADHIRKTEAAILHLRWVEAEENAQATREALRQAESLVAELMVTVAQGTTTRTELAAELPGLRQNEAVAAAFVQKLSLARDQNESEAKRVEQEISAETQRKNEAEKDFAREQTGHQDAHAALERLTTEEQDRRAKLDEIAALLPDLLENLARTETEVGQLDTSLTDLLKANATAEAQQKALENEHLNLTRRHAQLSQRREALDAERALLVAETAARPDLSLALAMLEACDAELAKRQKQTEDAEHARREAEATQNTARDSLQASNAVFTKLRAEHDAIANMLAHHDSDTEQLIDVVTVAPGLEGAMAVALGEALSAALDPQAAMHWRLLPPLENPPSLPEGAAGLDGFIEAPPALARCLSQIGLVEDRGAGEALSANLKQGQILVSRDGWAWRWDGFTISPEAKTANALRLQQRNRLAALKTDLESATSSKKKAEDDLAAATALLDQAKGMDRETRSALQNAFAALNDARNHYAKQERAATTTAAKMAAVDDSLKQVVTDLDQVQTRLAAIAQERAALPSLEAMRHDINHKRVALAEARSTEAGQKSERDRLTREKQIASDRLIAIAQERLAWNNRMAGASRQIETLSERLAAHRAKLEELTPKPAALRDSLGSLLSELSTAEAARREAADRLIATEQKLGLVEQKLKQDESSLAAARESRIRAEAQGEAALAHFDVLRERMAEKLNAEPADLRAMTGFSEGETWPCVTDLEQTLARYVRERDNMGPVNLRAEVEAETIQGEMDKLLKEKEDLTAAIAKLRHGINQLNREARERLQGAFSKVNERFQILFKRLFGGGKAHLELIDNDDPLNAGLEIFASPPGKKLQILSLLSGGERTLTALALLFAVFQTNPSPICVLDEAEAALDESNIDRFCKLVDDISRETGTRFLIITHQRVTMAHMDRLYGVTMSEKGVSQLVSVDLDRAVALRDQTAHQTQTATALDSLTAVRAA